MMLADRRLLGAMGVDTQRRPVGATLFWRQEMQRDTGSRRYPWWRHMGRRQHRLFAPSYRLCNHMRYDHPVGDLRYRGNDHLPKHDREVV